MSVSSAGVTPPVCPQLSDELRVASTDIAAVAREGLLVMSVTGLQVMAELMDDELAGPAHVLKALSAPPSATQTCANVCRHWCGWTCPMPAWSARRSSI